MILKDSKEAIEADINARRLNHLLVKRFYLDPTALYLSGNIAIA
jgi:hypothetical protein